MGEGPVQAGEGGGRDRAPDWKTGHFQQLGDVTCKKMVEGRRPGSRARLDLWS